MGNENQMGREIITMAKGRIEVRRAGGDPTRIIDVVVRTVIPMQVGRNILPLCRYGGALHVLRSTLTSNRECLQVDRWLESLYIEVLPETLGRDC